MHKYLQKTNSNFQTCIWPWGRSRWATLFWAFFLGMVHIFILQQIVAQRARLHPFYICCSLLSYLLHWSHPIFFCVKFGTLRTQKEQQIWIGDCFGWANEVYFANFLHLFIQGPPITHSAMFGWLEKVKINRLFLWNTNIEQFCHLFQPPSHWPSFETTVKTMGTF